MATKQIIKNAELKNPDRLPKDRLGAIIKHFGRLAELDAAVAARVVRYVVDGDDEAVLLTLGGMKEAAKALVLSGIPHMGDWKQLQAVGRERALFLRPGVAAPGCLVRLGQVFDAARRAAKAPSQPPPQGWPGWLATLLREIVAAWKAQDPKGGERAAWPVSELEAVLQSAGLATDLIARAFLTEQWAHNLRSGYYVGGEISPFSGWDAYLARHLEAVRDALTKGGANQRLFAVRTLGRVKFDCTPVVDLLVQLGVGSSKTVREAVLTPLSGCRDQARPLIERFLTQGGAAQRHEAALLLWRLFGREAEAGLREYAAGESSDRVKQTVETLLAAPAEASEEAARELAASLPPVRVEVGEVDLPAEAKQGLREVFDRAWELAQKDHAQAVERWNSPNRPKWMREPTKPTRPPAKALESLCRFVEGKSDKYEDFDPVVRRYVRTKGALGDWLAPPEVRLIHVVRLAHAFEHLRLQARGAGAPAQLWWHNQAALESYRGRCAEPFGLRELDAVVASLPGGRPNAVAEAYLASNAAYGNFCDWEPAAVWPIFAEHPEILHSLLGASPNRGAHYSFRDYAWKHKHRAAFKVLAMFPQLPPGFIAPLWELALGESKTERPQAQAALASVPDKASRILVALDDGKAGVRYAAAEWLGKIGDPSAVAPLKAAFRKEEQEVVKGGIMTALEALGADVQEFLDRDALLAEAAAGLAKKRPRGMEWVPLDSLPPLHWEDTGSPVDSRIVQWWLVQGVQQESPVCGPLLRRYLGMCRPHEAAALARFVLSAWIGHDTRVRPQEEAAERSRKEADQTWARYGQQQYFINHYKGDKENLYRQLFQKYSTECVGSAAGQKGMLAVVSAAGDGDCVKRCEQYIRKWFGNRMSQCKALVEVLAWVKHPLGVQVLLSLGNRFRTKAIRQAAEAHVQALADREGWTIDELADRTIPDAGFERPADESGAPVGDEAVLVLDYGPRKFTVRLDDELQPVVTTEEGKTVKNPPAAGKQDDPEKAKAARKAFSAAKKMVKEVVKRQTERLYESLCTQRAWRFEDWRRYLANHPIAGRLCVRLAWAVAASDATGGAERFLGCFRPLEDGSLTNEKDEEVAFGEGVLVRLAHTCNTPADAAAAWVKHFEDYDVEPPFPQFGRETYTLPEEKKKETDINDFEGHQITTFRLRGKATKLGYIRGEGEDGGWFRLYRKPFPSLGVQAVLEFTGNSLPEEDRPAALESLFFTAIKGDKETASSWDPGKLPLGKVPPVLLSECYNDVKQLAAEGSGFDPKWREKSYY